MVICHRGAAVIEGLVPTQRDLCSGSACLSHIARHARQLSSYESSDGGIKAFSDFIFGQDFELVNNAAANARAYLYLRGRGCRY